MCWVDAIEGARDALDDACRRGEIDRELCTDLLDLMDKVERECEKLEERMRADRYTHSHMGSENYDLRAENKQLRSLVSRMYGTIHGIAETYPTVLDPSLHTRLSEPFQQRADEAYADEMRELGIEGTG